MRSYGGNPLDFSGHSSIFLHYPFTMRISTTIALLSVTLLALAAVEPAAVPARQLCADADRQFQLGTAALPDDAAVARSHFEAACIRYEQALLEPAGAGIDRGAVLYNLGNAYARLGDLPNAIANYRRALLYLPGDRDLRSNLECLRAQRRDHFAVPEESRVLRTLFFWHYDLTYRTRLVLAMAAGGLFWLLAAVMLWRRPAWLKCAFAVVAVLAAAMAASTAASMARQRSCPAAVVSASEVTLRQGDSDGYRPALDAPVHAGTEVEVLECRGSWSQVRLPDGLSGWLPNHSLIIL